MFTKNIHPVRHEVPNEPGQWVRFVPLSWSQLEEARQVRTIAVIAVAGEIPSEVYEKMSGLQGRDEVPDLDPADSYDKAFVLNASIKAWSYGEKLNAENVGDMSETTASWALHMALFISLSAGGG